MLPIDHAAKLYFRQLSFIYPLSPRDALEQNCVRLLHLYDLRGFALVTMLRNMLQL